MAKATHHGITRDKSKSYMKQGILNIISHAAAPPAALSKTLHVKIRSNGASPLQHIDGMDKYGGEMKNLNLTVKRGLDFGARGDPNERNLTAIAALMCKVDSTTSNIVNKFSNIIGCVDEVVAKVGSMKILEEHPDRRVQSPDRLPHGSCHESDHQGLRRGSPDNRRPGRSDRAIRGRARLGFVHKDLEARSRGELGSGRQGHLGRDRSVHRAQTKRVEREW